MIQIVMVILSVSMAGEPKMTGVPFDDLDQCYDAARHFMEAVAGEFDNLGMQQISAACMIRRIPKPA